MTNAIYALKDPRTDSIRYIGVTKLTPARRLASHLRTARRGEDSHRARWVRLLLKAGVVPVIAVVETTQDRTREVFWIAHYRRMGLDLVNATDGGDGGRGMSQEARSKISAALRRRVITPEARANMSLAQRGHRVLPSTKEKLRAALLGRKNGPLAEATKAKMRAAKLGHEVGVDTRIKISNALKALPRRARKLFCHRGHAFAPENTRINCRGAQECRTCDHINYQLRKAAA